MVLILRGFDNHNSYSLCRILAQIHHPLRHNWASRSMTSGYRDLKIQPNAWLLSFFDCCSRAISIM